MKAIDRFYDYMTENSLKPTAVEKEIGLSNGYLSAQKKRNADMGEGVILKIIDYFRDINLLWLITGEGNMKKTKACYLEKDYTLPIVSEPILNYGKSEESIYYKMYKEEKEENKELLKQIGRLEEKIKSLENKQTK